MAVITTGVGATGLIGGLGIETEGMLAGATAMAGSVSLFLAPFVGIGLVISSILNLDKIQRASEAQVLAINNELAKYQDIITYNTVDIEDIRDQVYLAELADYDLANKYVNTVDTYNALLVKQQKNIELLESLKGTFRGVRSLLIAEEEVLPTIDYATAYNSHNLNKTIFNTMKTIADTLFDMGIIDAVEITSGDYFSDRGIAKIYGFDIRKGFNILDIQQQVDLINDLHKNMPLVIEGLKELIEIGTKAGVLIPNNVLKDTPTALGNVGIVNLAELLNPTFVPPETVTEEGAVGTVTPSPRGLGDIDLNALARGATISSIYLFIKLKDLSLSKTKNEDSKDKRKKRRKQKKRKKPKQKSKKTPTYIKKIWVDVSRNSEWIKTLTFEFPKKTLYNTDSRGTLTFTLKDGHVIRKVRVNRGTFSAIVMWVYRQHKGAGYRYWSQFNKARIKNREVYSWSLPRIDANDRRIGINRELQNKKVHYK